MAQNEILVIDENPTMRRYLTELLRKYEPFRRHKFRIEAHDYPWNPERAIRKSTMGVVAHCEYTSLDVRVDVAAKRKWDGLAFLRNTPDRVAKIAYGYDLPEQFRHEAFAAGARMLLQLPQPHEEFSAYVRTALEYHGLPLDLGFYVRACSGEIPGVMDTVMVAEWTRKKVTDIVLPEA